MSHFVGSSVLTGADGPLTRNTLCVPVSSNPLFLLSHSSSRFCSSSLPLSLLLPSRSPPLLFCSSPLILCPLSSPPPLSPPSLLLHPTPPSPSPSFSISYSLFLFLFLFFSFSLFLFFSFSLFLFFSFSLFLFFSLLFFFFSFFFLFFFVGDEAQNWP